MNCAWQELLHLIPQWMRPDVDKQGRDVLQELRIRRSRAPVLIMSNGIRELDRVVTQNDITYILNTASAYSPWAASTMTQGFLSAKGGHRIGICGSTVVKAGQVSGFCQVDSLCIRIARDFPGSAASLSDLTGSVLILGPPGSGKTTLLRDLIRQISLKQGKQVAVIDERKELFPVLGETHCFDAGANVDVISGCDKAQGIEIVLRNMSPNIIAMDEITAQEDAKALLHAGWCGVDLLTTAHGSSIADLHSRPIYRALLHSNLFSTVIIMKLNKTWKMERVNL